VAAISVACADVGVPIFKNDVFHGEPASVDLRYATDVVPFRKPGVDIAVLGHAYGRDSRSIEAGFGVGACEKVLRVLGPRCWSAVEITTSAGPGLFSPRFPFSRACLWGCDTDAAGNKLIHEQNPVGWGLPRWQGQGSLAPASNYRKRGHGARIKDRPATRGLVFIPDGGKPRAQFAGHLRRRMGKSRRHSFQGFRPALLPMRFPRIRVMRGDFARPREVVLRNLTRAP